MSIRNIVKHLQQAIGQVYPRRRAGAAIGLGTDRPRLFFCESCEEDIVDPLRCDACPKAVVDADST